MTNKCDIFLFHTKENEMLCEVILLNGDDSSDLGVETFSLIVNAYESFCF